jgi:hypothetical protein
MFFSWLVGWLVGQCGKLGEIARCRQWMIVQVQVAVGVLESIVIVIIDGLLVTLRLGVYAGREWGR